MKNKELKNQILVLAPSEGIVPADTWLRCRKKLMANITFQGGRKPKNTWLARKMKCGHCGRALKSMGNQAGTQYLRCSKRTDNMSCEGCGTLRMAEFEQFVYEAMVHKLSEFQTLTAKAETVNPRLTALNVELAQVEDEIEKLLNTLTGASAFLMSYANGKIEELDTRRQGLIKEIAALNAESVSPQKIEYLSSHLGNWDNIDFDDRRRWPTSFSPRSKPPPSAFLLSGKSDFLPQRLIQLCGYHCQAMFGLIDVLQSAGRLNHSAARAPYRG